MEDKNAKKRLGNLDFMKAVAILMVISLHIGNWDTDFVTYFSVGRLTQYICRLVAEGVPIFLMVNGYLLLRKRQLDLRRHIRKIGKMAALLVVWAVILTVVGNALSAEPTPLSLNMLFSHVFATRAFAEYTGVLWFLEYLLPVYMLYPLLWIAYKDNFAIFKYFFIAIVIVSAAASAAWLLRDVVAVYGGDASILNLLLDFLGFMNPFGSLHGGFVWYVLHFMLGGLLCHYEEQIYRKRVLFIVLGGLSWVLEAVFGIVMSNVSGGPYFESFPYGTGLIAIWIIGLFALTLPYENTGILIRRFVASVGENTFGIYLSHFLFIFVCQKFYVPHSCGERFIVYIVVFLMSYLFSLLVAKVPYVKWLITI